MSRFPSPLPSPRGEGEGSEGAEPAEAGTPCGETPLAARAAFLRMESRLQPAPHPPNLLPLLGERAGVRGTATSTNQQLTMSHQTRSLTRPESKIKNQKSKILQ